MSRTACLLAILVLAGCAASPRAGSRPPPRSDLFISPAGEPFSAQGGASPLRQWFDGADTDRDGRLSLAEFTADHLRFFGSLDLDQDSVLSDSEITRYESVIAPEILSPSDRGGPGAARGGGQSARGGGASGRGGGGRGAGGGARAGAANPGGAGRPGGGVELGGAAQFGLLAEPEPVRAADANFDSRVTLEEWRAAALRRFNQLDLRHQGALSLDEWVWPRR